MKTFPLKSNAPAALPMVRTKAQLHRESRKLVWAMRKGSIRAASNTRRKGATPRRPAKHKYRIVHYDDVRII